MIATLVVFIVLSLVLGAALFFVITKWRSDKRDADDLRSRYGALRDVDEHRARAEKEAAELHQYATNLRSVVVELEQTAELESYGFYENVYDFDSLDEYGDQLKRIRESQKALVKAKRAAACTTEWEVSGSRRKGDKMVNQQLRLMLRAFNGECDAASARVKYNNVVKQLERIEKAFNAINKLGEAKSCHLTDEYLKLKRAELRIVHEYEEAKQAEKEEQRRIREQMREEQRALKEIEKAQRDAEKEELRYAKALEDARAEVLEATGEKHAKLQAKLAELELRLAEAVANRERAKSMAEQTRRGHVYVISNIGSFGQNVYKIGMTRRLDPHDRIKELGDASVPFQFDVHAMIACEDAPTLEAELHREFAKRRLNQVNLRREFFNVTLEEITAKVVSMHDGKIRWTRKAEAREYRDTLAKRSAEQRSQGAPSSQPPRGLIAPPPLSSHPPAPLHQEAESAPN